MQNPPERIAQTTAIDLAKGDDRTAVIFRFPRAEFFSPVPARREWENANGRRLQAINRYVDEDRDEIVCIYEALP